jgi:hypothetical protein
LKRRNSNLTGRTDDPRKGLNTSRFYTTPGDATQWSAQRLVGSSIAWN